MIGRQVLAGVVSGLLTTALITGWIAAQQPAPPAPFSVVTGGDSE